MYGREETQSGVSPKLAVLETSRSKAGSTSPRVAVRATFAFIVSLDLHCPLHLRRSPAFNWTDGTLYTLHELASTLTAEAMPAAPNATSTITTQLSTVPPNNLTDPVWAAAEILIPDLHPDANFSTPYIYTSNRNTGTTVDPRGDTIAIFKILDSGSLELVQQVYTGLQQVRGMWIGGPDDEFVVAGGVVGTGGVVVFRRTEGGANLEEVARNTDIPTRTSFVFGDW